MLSQPPVWAGNFIPGQSVRQIKELRGDERWMWTIRGLFRRKVENMPTAAQSQAIRTDYRNVKIEKDGL